MPAAQPAPSAALIDLRSDTVTRPTPAMLAAMTAAPLGDDVLGDDPTVLELQRHAAAVLGKEAACFVPSGTMANQCAIRAATEPGDEVIAHEDSHIIHYETGAPAALSGVMIRPLRGPLGLFDEADVRAAVRPRSSHFACSKMLIVENTHNRGGGAVWPLDQIRRVSRAAREAELHRHLDGARIWNASTATGVSPAEYAAEFDSISCCFSKGLGAPVGSLVAGTAAFVTRVHRFRKMFGGAMRQAGVLAAAALYALEHHRARLSDDHNNAKRLEAALHGVRGVTIAMPVATNMVFFDLDPSLGTAAAFCETLKAQGVLALPNSPQRVRLVTHLDVNAEMCHAAARVVADLATARQPRPNQFTPAAFIGR
ncbi:low-specificity L-threonine aldolase [soil metagenome]